MIPNSSRIWHFHGFQNVPWKLCRENSATSSQVIFLQLLSSRERLITVQCPSRWHIAGHFGDDFYKPHSPNDSVKAQQFTSNLNMQTDLQNWREVLRKLSVQTQHFTNNRQTDRSSFPQSMRNAKSSILKNRGGFTNYLPLPTNTGNILKHTHCIYTQ